MGRIIKLPKEISTKIAAGEVIERPASVVKELVENSLDARADDIRVDLIQGGKGLIRVADNGVGMSREDARLCFESHATSKLAHDEDLERIATLGFRGEALASIASVARVTLKTAEPGAESGFLVRMEGGEILKQEEIAFPPGTSLEIQDLFFNLPARRKFLRSERAELNRIVQWLSWTALAHPGVRFALTHGPRKVFDYPGVAGLRERIYQIHGKAVVESLIEIRAREEGREVTGFASRPPSARSDRRHQYFFINSRPVKDSTLQAALNQAYRGLLEKDRFAEAFIFLTIPPEIVDVNVHPAKAEIRFRDERSIFRFVYRGVGESLLREMGIKEIAAPARSESPGTAEVREDIQPPLMGRPREEWRPAPEAREGEPPPTAESGSRDGPRVLGQYLGMYIVAVDEAGLLIIDQHNAHERVLFDKYREIDRERDWPRTLALHPPLLELSPSQIISLEENGDLLEEAGFRAEPMGGESWALKEYPEVFKEEEARGVFLALLEDVGSEKLENKKHRLLATLACRTAIKAGEHLSLVKMDYLVDELFKTSNPALCPHGRPVTLRLRRGEIEKALGRRPGED